jgi:hypothetical protein
MTTMINPQTGPLSEDLPGAEPALLGETVPRTLVHRVSASEVFVTDMRVTGFNTFEVDARWPGDHDFYGPTTRYSHDPMLLVESMRQAGLMIAHVAFEVPGEFKFITHEKRFDIAPGGLYTDGDAAVDVVIAVTAHDIRRRGRGFAGMLFEYTCFRDGRPIATAAIRWSCVSAAGYARLRGGHVDTAPSPSPDTVVVRPELVGRTDEINVMIAENPDGPGWLLRLDPLHPVVFDHPVDHVPGMAAVEAARQAALVLLGQPHALPVRGDFSLKHYVEFDQPCLILVAVDGVATDGATIVRVELEQDGHTAAEGCLEMLNAA